MATKKRAARERRRYASVDAPIVVMPKQTATAIESRQRIREALHDAKAVIVRPRRIKRVSRSR